MSPSRNRPVARSAAKAMIVNNRISARDVHASAPRDPQRISNARVASRVIELDLVSSAGRVAWLELIRAHGGCLGATSR